jgi:hypothetical protein
VTQLSRSSPRTVYASSKSACLSRNEPRSTEDGTRHEDDREADPASEHDGDQRDRCDNEPLLYIRKPAQIIN